MARDDRPRTPDDPVARDDPADARDDPADAAALAEYAAVLADGIEAAIPGWVEGSVRRVLVAQGIEVSTETAAAAVRAGTAARDDGGPRVRAVLEADVDDQAGNPLAVLRTLVRYPTDVLRSVDAQPAPRDEFAAHNFPDDVYDLSPATFADVDPALHEPGLIWGAAKAHVHLARRRRQGKR